MTYPQLLTANSAVNKSYLVIGHGSIAAARTTRLLDVGANVVVIIPSDLVATEDIHYKLQVYQEEKRISLFKTNLGCVDQSTDSTQLRQALMTSGSEETDGIVDAVFLTYSKAQIAPRSATFAHILSKECRRLRIPLNVVDSAELSTFTLLASFEDGPLQVGVTTNGRGCKMASRIKREIRNSLPVGLGDAVDRMSRVRRAVYDRSIAEEVRQDEVEDDDDDSFDGQSSKFNKLVTDGFSNSADRKRRWVAQMCEYWPIDRLAKMDDEDVERLLEKDVSPAVTPGIGTPTEFAVNRVQEFPLPTVKKGKIILAGSGPGHPMLLTRAAHQAIETADIVLADKLVPAGVMALIPRRTPVHIARKYPGNADKAQEELLQMGLDGYRHGKTVLRLKQGDPYLYGRGAEEFAFFKENTGVEPIVIAGLTSALSGPLFANIPATHRSTADEILICTGTGRKGVAPQPPTYAANRTVVFLMALHRLESLISSLEQHDWPMDVPCAIIERASCPDQRTIYTTLAHVCKAFEAEGSRPPGLLAVGNACEVLMTCRTQNWIIEDGFRSLDRL